MRCKNLAHSLMQFGLWPWKPCSLEKWRISRLQVDEQNISKKLASNKIHQNSKREVKNAKRKFPNDRRLVTKIGGMEYYGHEPRSSLVKGLGIVSFEFCARIEQTYKK